MLTYHGLVSLTRTETIDGADSGYRGGAVDVQYPDSGGARAAVVVASDRRFATIVDERVAWLDDVDAVRAGQLLRP